MKLLSSLSRVTNPGRTFIPQIDGLRFVAIMGVIATHSRHFILFHHGLSTEEPAGPVERTFYAGHFGVQLFFAISGFILALPFAKQMIFNQAERLQLKDYYLRRVTRIEPPYVIHLFFLFLLSVLVFRHLPADVHNSLSQDPHWLKYVLSHLVSDLFYSSGFIYGGHPALNGVLWSLEIEVQFYIVAPFLAQVFRISAAGRRRAVIGGSMIVASILSNFIRSGIFTGGSLLAHIQFFLAGFLLVDFYLTKDFSFTACGFKWDLILPVILAFIAELWHSEWFYYYLMPWMILISCLGAFHGRISSWLLSRPLITTIGGMCYTIYMYHYHLLSVVMRATIPFETHILWLDFLIQYLIVAVLIVLICSVLFAAFERPFMRRDWPARFWSFIRCKGAAVGAADLAPQPTEATIER